MPLTSEMMSLADEPIVLVRGGRVYQLNKHAEALFGADSVGKSVRELFGEELASSQAPNYAASVRLCGLVRTVRVSRREGSQVIFVSREERDPALLNEASFAAMRSCLMNLELGAEQCRRRAEALGDAELDESFAAVTRQHFQLDRMTANAGIVYSVLHGELPVKPELVDLAQLCRETANTLSLLRPEPRLCVTLPEKLELVGDRKLLESLLLNLLSNSLRHAAGCTAITLRLTEAEQSVILSLSDDGCGIPPERMSTVFNRYRDGFDASAPSAGCGLGLSVVRAVAARHGGTLLLESREGHGTAVRVSLAKRMAGAEPLASQKADFEMRSFLTGLAGCLPDECYRVKYLD